MNTLRDIEPATGFSREIGRWFTAIDRQRESLMDGIEELSSESLARRTFAGANTIGTLLIHIAEAELFWIQEVIRGEKLDEDQRREYRFDTFGKPDAPQVDLHDVYYFRKRLDVARTSTRETLQLMSDDEIDSRRVWEESDSGDKREFTVRWILNHVAEHESHHRGQIFLLKGALGY